MNPGELTRYDYVASLTAELRCGGSRQFQNISGGITAVPSAASAMATAAAFSAVTSRLGGGLLEIRSVAIDALDIFA